MIQNTSETYETLQKYTIPRLEKMCEAMVDNNDYDEKGNGKSLEGAEAVDFFVNGGVL